MFVLLVFWKDLKYYLDTLSTSSNVKALKSITLSASYFTYFTFTFSHLADAFIQSDLQIRKSN